MRSRGATWPPTCWPGSSTRRWARAIVIALVCGGTWARVAAGLDLAVMVFIGNVFGGLSHLEVAAVGHFTAALTASACVLIIPRPARGRLQPAEAPP